MGLSRTGRIGRLAAHCAEARAVSALRAARALAAFWLPGDFCVFLRSRAFVLEAAWRGVVRSSIVCIPLSSERHTLVLTFAARVKSGN